MTAPTQHSRLATSRNRVPRSRRATSLTEVLVVMTVASVIVGLSGMMIQRLLAAEHEATRTARFNASLTRLSRAFRADIHAARDVSLHEPDGTHSAALVAKLAERHDVRLEIDAHRATRIETVDGQQVHRDEFYFPPGSRLRFERSPDGKLVRLDLEMSVHRPGAKDDTPRRKLVMEAVPGRDHRFERTSRAEGERR